MRIFAFCWIVALVALTSGCATHEDGLGSREEVSYFDRNGDGFVDLEKHHYRGVSDADWRLYDDDYNGRYERKVLLGYSIIESDVDIPVPTDVYIEKK